MDPQEHRPASNEFAGPPGIEPRDADDPLGDEAPFPSTWQHLLPGDEHDDAA